MTSLLTLDACTGKILVSVFNTVLLMKKFIYYFITEDWMQWTSQARNFLLIKQTLIQKEICLPPQGPPTYAPPSTVDAECALIPCTCISVSTWSAISANISLRDSYEIPLRMMHKVFNNILLNMFTHKH